MASKMAEMIIFDVIDELSDRRGFDDWWFTTDESIRKEIVGKLVGIVDHDLNQEAYLVDALNSELDAASQQEN